MCDTKLCRDTKVCVCVCLCAPVCALCVCLWRWGRGSCFLEFTVRGGERGSGREGTARGSNKSSFYINGEDFQVRLFDLMINSSTRARLDRIQIPKKATVFSPRCECRLDMRACTTSVQETGCRVVCELNFELNCDGFRIVAHVSRVCEPA